jgi:hypothetical protein
MSEDRDQRDRDDETLPLAKRDGRDSSRPREQPGEFTDEMRVNRFTPPPDPKEK